MMHDTENYNYWGMHLGWWSLLIIIALIIVGFLLKSRSRR